MEAFDPFNFESEGFVESVAVDFPVDCFPDFPEIVATATEQHAQLDEVHDSDLGTIEISEELTATYYTQLRQCSVKVTGTISAGGRNRSEKSWDISLLDPKQQIDEIKSKSTDCVTALGGGNSFRLKEQHAHKRNSPLLEYSCGSSLRPVPMVSCRGTFVNYPGTELMTSACVCF